MYDILLKYKIDIISKLILSSFFSSYLIFSIFEYYHVSQIQFASNGFLMIQTGFFLFISIILLYVLSRLINLNGFTNGIIFYALAVSISFSFIPFKPNYNNFNYVGLKSSIDYEPDYNEDQPISSVDSDSRYELLSKFDKEGISDRIKEIKSKEDEDETGVKVYKEYFIFPATGYINGYKSIIMPNREESKINLNFFSGFFILIEWFINGIQKYFFSFFIFYVLKYIYQNRAKNQISWEFSLKWL